MKEMASIKFGNLPLELKIAMSEMTRGQELATKLAIILRDEVVLPPPMAGEHGCLISSAARALVDDLLGSFSKAIPALDAAVKEEVLCQSPAVSAVDMGSPSSPERRDVNSGGASKARRGAYRTRAHPYNWKTKTSKTIADGYTWRKYGQKVIYGAKYQRSYFRCTYKHDQGCKATKQVQQSEEDPSMFVITYMGEHTCRDTKALASSTPNLISFGSVACGYGSHEPPVSAITTSLQSLKQQEADEEVVSSRTPGCSSSEQFVLPDVARQLGWAAQPMTPAAGAIVDYGDVTSVFHSSASNFEFDITEEAFDIDELLNLDHQEEPFYS